MITTYAELKTALTNYTHRDDVAARAGEFISLAEALFKKKLRQYPIIEMESETDLTCTAGQESLTLPSDFLSIKDMYIDGNTKTHLDPVSLSYMRSVYAGSETSKPLMYAVGDGKLTLAPTPDSDYTVKLTYYAFPVLSDDNVSNWLLEDHPDLYLAGSLAQAFMWAQNTEKAMEQMTLTGELLNNVIASGEAAEFSGSPLVIRTA